MKKFLGTKEVLATPMTRLEYNNYRGWELPSNELSQAYEPGYLVEYLDGGRANDSRHQGYISWSPADVFYKAYAPYETWLDRVKKEQVEVQIKLDALNKTMNVESKPDFISDKQWIFMTRQQFHMRQYNQILLDRIHDAQSPEIDETAQLTGSEDNN